jgi:molybdopterin synthase catalytic subunit
MQYLKLYDGALDVHKITNSWYDQIKDLNYGAIITFVGIVRDEDGIDGLSFDIYEPILKQWFNKWQQKAKEKKALVMMAHSIGDVPNHTTSFICAICSPKRRVSLEMIDQFVEDFKASAPIWKYDLKDNKRIYAKDRSTPIEGAGLLC